MSKATVRIHHRQKMRGQKLLGAYLHARKQLEHPAPQTMSKNISKMTPKRRAAYYGD